MYVNNFNRDKTVDSLTTIPGISLNTISKKADKRFTDKT